MAVTCAVRLLVVWVLCRCVYGCWVGVIGATVEPAVPLVVYANPYADDYQAGESLLSWSPFLQ